MHTHAYPRTPMQVPGALKPMAMHTHAYPRTPMQVPGALKLYLHSAEHDHIVDKINSSHRVNELWFGASCCAPSNFLCARPRIPPTPSSHRFSTPHPPPPYPNWPLHPTWPYIHIYMCTWTHAYTPPQASRSPRPLPTRCPILMCMRMHIHRPRRAALPGRCQPAAQYSCACACIYTAPGEPLSQADVKSLPASDRAELLAPTSHRLDGLPFISAEVGHSHVHYLAHNIGTLNPCMYIHMCACIHVYMHTYTHRWATRTCTT